MSDASANGESDISTSFITASTESRRSRSARYVMWKVVFHTAPSALR